MARWLRRIFLFAMVATIVTAITYYIVTDDMKKREAIYYERSTLAVQTAIAAKGFELTRTAEAETPQYRLVTVEAGTPLLDIAEQYHTTLEVLRMANNLPPTVDVGDGGAVIVPEGVAKLEPPRRFTSYLAAAGETLDLLAVQFGIDVEQLKIDNPVLAARELLPGDVVFVPEILN